MHAIFICYPEGIWKMMNPLITDGWRGCSTMMRVTQVEWIEKWHDKPNHVILLNDGKYPAFKTLRPRQNGRHFADDIFKCIFLNENVWIPVRISLKYVPEGPFNNILALVQIMAWCWSGDKPLSEPMVVGLPTHICVTRPQWVKNTGTQSLIYHL